MTIAPQQQQWRRVGPSDSAYCMTKASDHHLRNPYMTSTSNKWPHGRCRNLLHSQPSQDFVLNNQFNAFCCNNNNKPDL